MEKKRKEREAAGKDTEFVISGSEQVIKKARIDRHLKRLRPDDSHPGSGMLIPRDIMT